MTILTVDDDIEDQELFYEVISMIDPAIVCLKANDGTEAYELLTDGKMHLLLDYIFIDINMPKMNGIELLLLIKKHEHLKNIPVFMLSTSCSQSELAKINLLGSSMLQKQNAFGLSLKMLKGVIKAKPIEY